MKLGILIPTMPGREVFFEQMYENIDRQRNDWKLWDDVIIISDNTPPPMTTGAKRNELLKHADDLKCTHVWQVDDDDDISHDAIPLIVNAFSRSDADVIGINGWMTTDGANRVDWEIRLGHPYCATQKDGREYYLRFPNHITPMKLEHAIKIKFPDKTIFEDYEWAKALNDAGHLKTQIIIDKPIYHYKHRTKK